MWMKACKCHCSEVVGEEVKIKYIYGELNIEQIKEEKREERKIRERNERRVERK